MQNNRFQTPTARCVFLFYTELIPTLKSHKVAGLFGLPPNDAYAVVQTQKALNGERDREDLPLLKAQSCSPFKCGIVQAYLTFARLK